MSASPPTSLSSAYALHSEKLRSLHDCSTTSQPTVLAVCGSLNPVHNAHIKLYETAKVALTARGGVSVLGGFLSPVSDAYGKPGLKSAAQRVRIAEDAVREHAELSVDRWECMQPTYTRTFYVLQELEKHVNAWYAAQEPEAVRRVRVALVCGADLFSSFWIPGCWPLHLLKLLLETFPLVVVYRSAAGDVKTSEDLERLCATCPVLTETVNGTTTNVQMRDYDFTFAQFSDPDDTSSTAVRDVVAAMAAANPSDVATREGLRVQLSSMVPEGAVASILECYGEPESTNTSAAG